MNLYEHSHSVRKERKIRPGFTPQEDVKLFQPSPAKARATVPKGYVPGWAPPAPSAASIAAKTAAAKKNEKRRKKKKEKAEAAEKEKVKDNWEDEEEEAGEEDGSGDVGGGEVLESLGGAGDTSEDASSARNKSASTEAVIKDMAGKLEKLQVT